MILSMFEQTRIEPNGTFWSTNLGNLALCFRGNLALCHGFDSGPCLWDPCRRSFISRGLVGPILIAERWTNAVIPFPGSRPRKYSMFMEKKTRHFV